MTPEKPSEMPPEYIYIYKATETGNVHLLEERHKTLPHAIKYIRADLAETNIAEVVDMLKQKRNNADFHCCNCRVASMAESYHQGERAAYDEAIALLEKNRVGDVV